MDQRVASFAPPPGTFGIRSDFGSEGHSAVESPFRFFSLRTRTSRNLTAS